MAFQLLSGPVIEPVSLTDAKAHLRVDHSDEDLLIGSLITAGRIHIEVTLSRVLNTQSWTLFLDEWPPDDIVPLWLAPVQSVDAVLVYDRDGVSEAVDLSVFDIDLVSSPPKLVRVAGAVLPAPQRVANGIEIRMTCGYGATSDDVPQSIRQALLMLVAHWFEHREPVSLGASSVEVPLAVASLLSPYQMVRL